MERRMMTIITSREYQIPPRKRRAHKKNDEEKKYEKIYIMKKGFGTNARLWKLSARAHMMETTRQSIGTKRKKKCEAKKCT